METQTKQKERMMKTERKTRTISEKRKKKRIFDRNGETDKKEECRNQRNRR